MAKSKRPESERGVRPWLGRRLTKGILLLLPLMVTFVVVEFVFNTFDDVLQPVIREIFDREITGLGFGIVLTALFLVGMLAPLVIFKYPARLFEWGFQKLPFVGALYKMVKQIAQVGAGKGAPGFQTVVRIEYPRKGVWAVGFLTGKVMAPGGEELGVVYIPTTPTPQSGWLALVSMKEVELLDWTPGQAMQFVFSAGVVGPATMGTSPAGGTLAAPQEL